MFDFSAFKQGIADMPRHYAVVMDLDVAKQAHAGYVDFDDLKDDPMMVVRAGGVEQAAAYLDKARTRGNADTIGSWHSFNEMDADQPQSCICLMYGSPDGARARIFAPEGIDQLRGVQTDFGLRGDTGMINMGRYVAGAPGDVAAGVRHLSFGA